MYKKLLSFLWICTILCVTKIYAADSDHFQDLTQDRLSVPQSLYDVDETLKSIFPSNTDERARILSSDLNHKQ